MRIFAKRYPDVSAGLVLVDPAQPEDWLNPGGRELERLRRGALLCRFGARASRVGIARVVSALVGRGALTPAWSIARWFTGGELRADDQWVLGPMLKLPLEARGPLRSFWTQRRFFEALPNDAHPMPVCAAAVAALATFYQEPRQDERTLDETVVRLIAKMPTIAAYSYKQSIGQPFIYPENRFDYASNFLHMMFATPAEDYEPDPLLARTLDLLLILHADHEQNCSTSTVRMVGSSQANLFASVSAGISALWGPLHGGANQQVIEMLERIEAEGGDVDTFVARAKDKKENSRLMGFGHRVYKNYDPRAAVLKRSCTEVLNRLGVRSRQLEIAMKLEEIALRDEYFISHKLYPNVDFYSGIIYKALGIPVNMFTVLFAMGRMPGWIAQWLEMRKDPATRIGRPRQIYTGATRRPYVGFDRRVY